MHFEVQTLRAGSLTLKCAHDCDKLFTPTFARLDRTTFCHSNFYPVWLKCSFLTWLRMRQKHYQKSHQKLEQQQGPRTQKKHLHTPHEHTRSITRNLPLDWCAIPTVLGRIPSKPNRSTHGIRLRPRHIDTESRGGRSAEGRRSRSTEGSGSCCWRPKASCRSVHVSTVYVCATRSMARNPKPETRTGARLH
jgi:hypothetical protein